MNERIRPVVIALLAGTVFGAGLAVAQMTNPAKVLSFLDVTGAWDPSLALVMASALAVMAVAWRHPRAAAVSPAASAIDARLLGGAVLFGLGWGLAGLCPGPAIAALSTGRAEIGLFVIALLGGMLVHHATLGAAPGAAPLPDEAPSS